MGRSVDEKGVTSMKCALCGGEFKEKIIIFDQPWGDELYRFENVPAKVCSQCGEIWLSAEVAEEMDRIIEKHEKPIKYERVPVYSLKK
jgi:YgiT-type zinc finger domain-containing protein